MASKNHGKENINRASYIVGHVKAVSRMLEEGAYCIDIIHQLDAVGSATAKLREKILEDHLKSCVIDKMKSGDRFDHQKVIEELLLVYGKKR